MGNANAGRIGDARRAQIGVGGAFQALRERDAGRALIRLGSLLSAILILCSLTAPSAGARVVLDKATGQRFGIVLPPTLARPLNRSVGASPLATAAASPTCSTVVDAHCAQPLANRGRGPVQHGERDYLFMWDPAATMPAGYVAGLQRWLSGLAAGDETTGHVAGTSTGNPVSVTQQYYDFSGPNGTKNFVPYAIQDSGTITDRDPYPSMHCTDTYQRTVNGQEVKYTLPQCVTAGQIQTELSHYVAAHHLHRGINTEYFVITPPGVGDCSDSSSSDCADQSYCGFHTTTGNGPFQIVYAVLPWLQNSTCDLSEYGVTPLHSAAIDTTVGVLSHELSESMTDPDLNAWHGPGGTSDEIGDKCAYQYAVGQSYFSFNGLPQVNGAYYNSTLGPAPYLVQTEYDNWAGGCTQWDTQPQPSVHISVPTGVRTGKTATLGLTHVSDPVGIAYVQWSFGDGHTARSSGSRSIRHTYSAHGQYPVIAIVTDRGGNEVKATATVRILKRRG